MVTKRVLTKFLALVLSFVMVLSCFPMSTLASEEENSLEVITDLPEDAVVEIVQVASEDTADEGSEQGTEEETSGDDTEGEEAEQTSEEETAGDDTEGEGSEEDTAEETSSDAAEGEGSEEDTAEETSGDSTEGEGSEEDTAEETSGDSTEGEGSEEDTTEETSSDATEGEGSEEDTAEETSSDATEGEGSEEDTAEEMSGDSIEGEESETPVQQIAEGTESDSNNTDSDPADPNDGKYAVVCTIESGNQSVEYYVPGETVTLKVPTMEHYVFTGWEVVCEKPITITNNRFVMPEARVDIAAQWEPETYSVAIYYLTLSGKNLRDAKFAEVTYGYDFSLDNDYSLPTIDGYILSKITREADSTNWTDFDNFRNFMNISSVEKDEVFYVWYEPSDVTYDVYHYKQNLDGTYPDDATESEEHNGKFGDKVTLSSYVKSYTGFTWDGNSDEITLATSGNVIRIYYTRNSYRLYYEKNSDDTDSLVYPYDSQIALSILGMPTRVGYTFAGWQTSSGEDVVGDSFTMPAHDVTFVAKWTPNQTTYTIYYWGETRASAQTWTDSYHATNSDNHTATAYGYIGKVTATGTVGTVIEESVVQNVASEIMDSTIYTYDTMDSNVTIAADGTTVVNVYYHRNVYWYGFLKGGVAYSWDGHTGYIYHKYGANVVPYWPTLDSNNNKIVWVRTSNGRIVQAASSAQEGDNVELKYSQVSDNTFTLWAYKENVNGGYEGAERYEYVTFSGFNYLGIAMIDSRLPEGFEYDSYYSVSYGWQPFPEDKVLEDTATIGSTEITLRRKLYTITFNDGNEDIYTSDSIRFEASIAGVTVPEITAPAAFEGYEFVGLVAAHNGVLYSGSTPQEAYDAFKAAINDSMLATNVTLTASWRAPIYTVNFYEDSSLNSFITGEKVERGKTVVNHPETPSRVNHTFNGWFYMENGVEKLYWEGKTILSNMDVYAKWIADDVIYADILVKHNYLAADGSIDRTEEETVQSIVGNVVTISAKETEGYFPDFISQNIEVQENGNVIEFNYVPLTEVSYTVRYVDADGNELIPEVVKMSDKLVVTETYRYIPRCTPRTISQTLKLSANPEKNIITFVYDVEGMSTYVIKHYLQELDGTYTLYETEENLEARNYTQVYATVRTYEGYEFNSDISNADGWVTPSKSLVLNMYYDRIEYTVEYRYKEGSVVPEGVADVPISVSYKFGETVVVADIPVAPKAYQFIGWYFVANSSEAIGTFEMPKENVIIEGYFEQLDYYIVIEWSHEDGFYHGGEYTWDCDKLEYVHDTSKAGWSVTPYVKVTVKNYGAKAVNLNFVADVDHWARFFAEGGNPFSNLSTVTLEGNGAEYVFEFSSDSEMKWDYDLLNSEAFNVAVDGSMASEHSNNFKLNITAVE